jgi:hypothetical protein
MRAALAAFCAGGTGGASPGGGYTASQNWRRNSCAAVCAVVICRSRPSGSPSARAGSGQRAPRGAGGARTRLGERAEPARDALRHGAQRGLRGRALEAQHGQRGRPARDVREERGAVDGGGAGRAVRGRAGAVEVALAVVHVERDAGGGRRGDEVVELELCGVGLGAPPLRCRPVARRGLEEALRVLVELADERERRALPAGLHGDVLLVARLPMVLPRRAHVDERADASLTLAPRLKPVVVLLEVAVEDVVVAHDVLRGGAADARAVRVVQPALEVAPPELGLGEQAGHDLRVRGRDDGVRLEDVVHELRRDDDLELAAVDRLRPGIDELARPALGLRVF